MEINRGWIFFYYLPACIVESVLEDIFFVKKKKKNTHTQKKAKETKEVCWL